MKLIWAVVQPSDASVAIQALNADGHRVTRLDSVGGFLKRGSVTLLTSAESEQVDAVVGTLRASCRSPDGSIEMRSDSSRGVVIVVDVQAQVSL